MTPRSERPCRTLGVTPELLGAAHSAIVGEYHAAANPLARIEDLAQNRLLAREPIPAGGEHDVDLPLGDGGEEAVESGTTAAEAAHSFITVDMIGHDRPAALLGELTQPFDLALIVDGLDWPPTAARAKSATRRVIMALLPSSCEISTH